MQTSKHTAHRSPLFNLWQQEVERWKIFFDVSFPTRPASPRWATDAAEEIRIADSVVLRVYGDRGARSVPVLIVTPQVNHSYIADFSPQQSLVRTLLDCGVKKVAVTDWQPPPSAEYSIADSLDDIQGCATCLGGRVHLVGLCQGGWQVTMLAASKPALAESLTLAAAPIDTHAGVSPLHLFTFGLPMSFFESIVNSGGGRAPGKMLAAGFDLMRPFERYVYNYSMLYLKALDAEFIERHESLRNWYRLNKDIAGRLYLETVRQLFKENRLAKGTMTVRDELVDLSAIRCPVNLVAGKRDHITPPAQLFALQPLTPHATSTRYLVDAGHIGVFMGRTALATVWKELGTACF